MWPWRPSRPEFSIRLRPLWTGCEMAGAKAHVPRWDPGTPKVGLDNQVNWAPEEVFTGTPNDGAPRLPLPRLALFIHAPAGWLLPATSPRPPRPLPGG